MFLSLYIKEMKRLHSIYTSPAAGHLLEEGAEKGIQKSSSLLAIERERERELARVVVYIHHELFCVIHIRLLLLLL